MDRFLEEYKGKVLRFWRYKRPGVKYDYCGEEASGPYIDKTCDYGVLQDMYTLPDNDVMVCIENDLSNGDKYREFYKLSEIDLSYSDSDQD